MKGHALRELQSGTQALRFTGQRVLSHDVEMKVVAPANQVLERPQQGGLILHAVEAGHVNETRCRPGARGSGSRAGQRARSTPSGTRRAATPRSRSASIMGSLAALTAAARRSTSASRQRPGQLRRPP